MIFHNYEVSKLLIHDVTYNNILIILIFVVLSLLSLKKSQNLFLGRIQTNQLKGFAIVMVVLGHLWIHVSQNPAFLIYGSYSVALFLFLSGFGLTLSSFKRKLNLKEFCSRRVSRVMIPYWIVTLLILIFDYILLKKMYTAKMMVLTFCGCNFDRGLKGIDYTRWYITLLLVCYILFFLVNNYFKKRTCIFFLFCSSITLFVLKCAGYFPIGSLYHYMAFPLGCLAANYKSELISFFYDQHKYFRFVVTLIFMVILLLIISAYNYYTRNDLTSFSVAAKIIHFVIDNIQATILYLVPTLFIGLIGTCGYKSGFLEFCGSISYELYLIHGVLLIKYNPLIEMFDTKYIAVSFMVLFVVLLGLSKFFNSLFLNLIAKIKLIPV